MMEKIRAIEILKDFNDYRRNEGVYDVDEPCEPKFTATEIGEAIDEAIRTMCDSEGKCGIIETVIKETGVSLDGIRSQSREREFVVAREIAAHLLRRYGYTFKEIGEVINRSHSNVCHLCDEAEYWASDPENHQRELKILKRVEQRVGESSQASQTK